MTSRTTLRTFYRTAEDYRRYSAADPAALRRHARVLREERRWVGRSVLDLGCGGGAFARLYEGPGRRYVGVDTNPDMIREARREARRRGARSTFVLADVRGLRLEGTFDTVTMLGNALSHLTARDLLRALDRLDGHLSPSAHLLVDYRDTVRLLFEGKWKRRYVQRKSGCTVVSTTRGVDLATGEILLSSRRTRGARPANFTQTIWSPFLVEAVLRPRGWRLVRRRREARWSGYLDVYRFRPPGS
jgi:SAM-dependent methyltransferase